MKELSNIIQLFDAGMGRVMRECALSLASFSRLSLSLSRLSLLVSLSLSSRLSLSLLVSLSLSSLSLALSLSLSLLLFFSGACGARAGGRVLPHEVVGEDVDLSRYQVHVIAGLFKSFFMELPEPLFTFDLYESFVSAAGT